MIHAVTFDEAYRNLEEKFRQQVEEDKNLRSTFKVESIYLPNMAPTAPVDYVLIGMEPSLGNWARAADPNQREDVARHKIEKGFRNFCRVWMLHYSVQNWLCDKEETYYVTDLAKGAMLSKERGAGSEEKYMRWYPLLEEEIGLVAKPEAKIISIGNKVGLFLSKQAVYSHACTIPHYSPQAVRYWGKEQHSNASAKQCFAKGHPPISRNTCYPGHVCLPEDERHEKDLTGREKSLLFDYKVRFDNIRSQETSGWYARAKNMAGQDQIGR